MNHISFDTWSRRRVASAIGGLAAVALGFSRSEMSAAKKKKAGKKLCKKNGARCRKESGTCKAKFCLNSPFRVEISFTGGFTNAYLFVPKQNANTGPSPYLNFACNSTSNSETKYPFATIDESDEASGDGVTTIHKLLSGKYEYWVQLAGNVPAGAVAVTLRDNGGRKVREWSSPANQGNQSRGWHVFDIDGKSGSIKDVDALINGSLPTGAHNPFTFVCTF